MKFIWGGGGVGLGGSVGGVRVDVNKELKFLGLNTGMRFISNTGF